MPNDAKGKVIRMSRIGRFILVFCIILNLCAAAHAVEDDINVDVAGYSATIKGNADYSVGTEVSIAVIRPQKSILNITSASLADSFLCIVQTSVTAAKDFTFLVNFDTGEKSGTYKARVQVYGENVIREKQFEFLNTTRQSFAVAALNDGTMSVDAVLSNYASDLDIKSGETYNAFSDKEKTYVKSAVSKALSSRETTFVDAVNAVSDLKDIKAQSNSKENLKKCIDAGNIPGVNTELQGKYSSLSEFYKGIFIVNLYNSLEAVDIPTEMKTEFENALKNSANESDKTADYQVGGTATVGGGGGGGFLLGGGSTTLPTNTTNNQSGDPANRGFADMDQAPWAENAINILSERGIIKGRSETEFCPQDTIKREEFLRLVIASLNIIGVSESENAFSDVDTDAWYASTIETAVACGIVSGMSEDIFGVGLPITRQDMATILYRAIKYAEVNLYSVAEPEFSDEDDIPDYAKEAVSALSKAKIINGMEDGTFMSQKTATRAEAAVMLYNLLYR